MLGTEELRNKKTEQEPQGLRGEEGQDATVGEKEDGKRKVLKSGSGRLFSFNVNTKLLRKKILCTAGPTSQILFFFLYVLSGFLVIITFNCHISFLVCLEMSAHLHACHLLMMAS